MDIANIVAHHSLSMLIIQRLIDLKSLIIVDQIVSIVDHFLLVLSKLEYFYQLIETFIKHLHFPKLASLFTHELHDLVIFVIYSLELSIKFIQRFDDIIALFDDDT